jgi:hypothetical protein
MRRIAAKTQQGKRVPALYTHFRRSHTIPRFIAVINVEDIDQAEAQASNAFDNGSQGIFIINHSHRLSP